MSSGQPNRALMDFGSKMANPGYNLMNPTNIPYGQDPRTVTQNLRAATNMINVEGVPGRDAYQIKPVPNTMGVPDNSGSRLREAIKICEAVKEPSCNAFKDPAFAATCMMTHGPGRNSKGEVHAGGLVLFKEDLEDQRQANRGKGRYATFNPTIGESASGKTSTDYKSCVAMDEKIRCEAQGNFDIPNCAMCMNGQGRFARVDPEATYVPPRLVVVGRGNITVYENGNVGNAEMNAYMYQGDLAKDVEMSETNPVTIDLTADSEGKPFTIRVNNPKGKPTLAGFLEGSNSTGLTRIDLAFLCDYEFVFGTKPVLIGSTVIDGESVSIMTTAANRKVLMNRRETALVTNGTADIINIMNVSLRIPYTFLDSSEEAAAECPGGPFSKKEASVTFLSSDPCFKPNAPGSHKLECLQNKFIQAGCTVSGEGYPANEELAGKLRYVNGRPQPLGSIAERIYKTSIEAATGISNGTKMPLAQWDEKSRWCTGKAIRTPCMGYDMVNGPLGDDCIQYLFENKGQIAPGSSAVEGRTYTLGQKYESLNDGGKFCTRQGSAAPYNQANLEKARQQGGVDGVKRYFNQLQLRAQDNSLSDEARKQAVKDCYGVDLAPVETQNANNPLQPQIGDNVVFGVPGTDRYLRHASFVTWHHPNDGSQLFRQDSSWKPTPPLCGKPGYMSFESVNFPDHYLINNNGRGQIVPREQTPEYSQRACWQASVTRPDGSRMNIMDPNEKLQNGVGCGLPGMTGLENAFTPGAFLRAGPGDAADLYIPKTEADRKATCFQMGNQLGNAKAKFYQHCNYGGRVSELGIGDYDLGQMGIDGDMISAVRVPHGLKVILYEHPQFRGRSLTVTEDDPCLQNDGFHDITSSLRVMRA